jgi:hypothetical protein
MVGGGAQVIDGIEQRAVQVKNYQFVHIGRKVIDN